MPKKKRTHEEYSKEIKEKYGDEYTLLSKYNGCDNKIKVRHNLCNTVWEANPGDLTKKKICPVCGKKKIINALRKDPEEFKKEFDKLSNDEYELLTDYIKDDIKLKIKHKKCNKIFEMKASKFLYGQRCPYCRNNRKKTKEEFEKEVYDLYGDEFTIVGGFVNTYTKIDLFHNKCKHTITVKPSDFLLKKTYCKYCNQSALESIIEKSLNDLGLEYDIQKTYPDLVGVKGNLLSYDFICKYKNKDVLIEGQGEQHYEIIKYFGNEEKFKKQQEHDRRKRQYAKSHNLFLIEVPYWEYKNTKNFIKNELDKIA